MKKTQAETFAEAIVQAVAASLGVVVIDLEEAAGQLWTDEAVWKRGGRALREAMAEVDERTKGQAFRLDGPDGPLFLDLPLWRFAGKSGLDHDAGRGPRKPRPSWDGAAEASRNRVAA